MKRSEDMTKLKEQIDQNLKRVYEEALDERIPDRFNELIEQLRRKESSQ